MFDKRQLKMCKRRPKFMKYVAEAAQLAISECMRLTFHHRWYCKDAIRMLPKTASDVRDGKKYLVLPVLVYTVIACLTCKYVIMLLLQYTSGILLE